MSKKACYGILIQTLPIILGAVLTYFLWHNNMLLTALFLLITAVVLYIGWSPGDLFVFAYGTVLGFAIEFFEVNIAKFHSFSNPDFFGMPLWMPIVWGYGFVLMKRIGVIIYEDTEVSSAKRKNSEKMTKQQPL